jgi:hypothetical protein
MRGSKGGTQEWRERAKVGAGKTVERGQRRESGGRGREGQDPETETEKTNKQPREKRGSEQRK